MGAPGGKGRGGARALIVFFVYRNVISK